jgi:hypothetical protein
LSDLDDICGRWLHAHEEDAGGEPVYRPEAYGFPPARGRTAIELRADGTYVEESPGPDDRPVASRGRWSRDGDAVVLDGKNRLLLKRE